MNQLKIIVAHPGQQHSYKLASALKKQGMLFKYITTVYYKKWSLTKFSTKILKGENKKRAVNRNTASLQNNDIALFYEMHSLINLLDSKIKVNNTFLLSVMGDLNAKFGKRVANYAIKNNVDAVIMYDTSAEECFRILKEKAPHIKRIMDVSSANRAYMRFLFENEYKSINLDEFKNEVPDYWDEKRMGKFKSEIKLSQYFLAPSHYVQESLEYSGVDRSQISIVPYGVDSEIFNNNLTNNIGDKINFLYVGRITYAKGFSYLMEAFKNLERENLHLSVVGDFNKNKEVFEKYKRTKNVKFHGVVTHDKMKDFYANADVLIIPSLSEGMSLSGLEALSSGLPLICTTHSGVNDIIKNYFNGFVISSGSSKEIEEKVKWFLLNKDRVQTMSENAKKTAKDHSWESYEKKIAKTVKNIVGK